MGQLNQDIIRFFANPNLGKQPADLTNVFIIVKIFLGQKLLSVIVAFKIELGKAGENNCVQRKEITLLKRKNELKSK